MNMNITITNVRNADMLDSFQPVEGEWVLAVDSDDRSESGVIQSVKNYMDAGYDLTVLLFDSRGHKIVDDMPSRGSFIAIRS